MLETASDSATANLRVMGVDPAAAGPTGYAVIERASRSLRVLHCGALRIAPKRQKIPAAALYDVHSRLCELIRQFKPNVLAVESVFAALNMRTALRLAEVRGVVLLAAEQHGLQIHSYTPREVKASVAGYGHADKRQMQIMVRAQLGMRNAPESPDAADALAVALCHLQADELERRFGLRRASLSPNRGARNSVPAARAGRATTRDLRIQPAR
jgi:crossover junction endodeoxyribonuclease RuvC